MRDPSIMTNEYIAQVKKQVELMAETERLNSRISEAVDMINSIFSEYGIGEKIAGKNIKFTNDLLTNNFFYRKDKPRNDFN